MQHPLLICLLGIHLISFVSSECFNFAEDSDDGVCYEIFLSKNWADASDKCHTFRSEVASVHNQQENSFIRRLAVSQGVLGGVLLGGAPNGKGNVFEWVDGTAWDYANFRTGYPKPGQGECLVMDTSATAGDWINADCSKPMPVVCARLSVSRATPTPTPTTASDGSRPIQESDPRYNAYKDISDLLGSWLNTTVDPCHDFYSFSCGNTSQSYINVAQGAATDLMLDQLRQPAEHFDPYPLPVRQMKWFYDACLTRPSYGELNAHSLKVFTDLRQANPGFGFPLFYPTETTPASPQQLAAFLGYSSGVLGLRILVTPSVETNWVDPQLVNGHKFAYALFVKQPTTMLLPSFYDKPHLEYMTDYISETIVEAATRLGIDPGPDSWQDARDIAQFDTDLATKYTNRSLWTNTAYSNEYHSMSLNELQHEVAPFLSWKTFFNAALTPISKTVDDHFESIVVNPDGLRQLSADIFSGVVSSRTLNNYLYIRAMMSWMSLPPDAGAESSCNKLASNLLTYAHSRLYVDARYPLQKDRNDLREQMKPFLGSLVDAFSQEIEQTDWMSATWKKNAQKKAENIVFNIAYPDWITDDAQLTEYYKKLDTTKQDSYLDQIFKLGAFLIYTDLSPLLVTGPADRTNFVDQSAAAKLLYQNKLNSLTVAGGLLHTPVYDHDYPAAVNYGALGFTTGQEMSLGFDKVGRQWDYDGRLNSWMDAGSAAGFDANVNCIDAQYGGFCPLGPSYTCLDADKTERENVADNAGLQMAYQAFKTFQANNGVDPRLPGPTSVFTADQLFFLGFAQSLCEHPYTAVQLEAQMQYDASQTPSHYRVLGTLQNTPAFKEAFNCPAGSVYAPAQHCEVWTPFNH